MRECSHLTRPIHSHVAPAGAPPPSSLMHVAQRLPLPSRAGLGHPPTSARQLVRIRELNPRRVICSQIISLMALSHRSLRSLSPAPASQVVTRGACETLFNSRFAHGSEKEVVLNVNCIAADCAAGVIFSFGSAHDGAVASQQTPPPTPLCGVVWYK